MDGTVNRRKLKENQSGEKNHHLGFEIAGNKEGSSKKFARTKMLIPNVFLVLINNAVPDEPNIVKAVHRINRWLVAKFCQKHEIKEPI